MKLFKNQKGFSDVITVAILTGVIGAIFIGGVFVWKEINKTNSINNFTIMMEQDGQNSLLDNICNSDNSGSIYDCKDYYIVTPSPLISDWPSNIINKSGELITKCGGLMQFINEEEKQKHSKLCSQYTINNCKIIKECRNRTE